MKPLVSIIIPAYNAGNWLYDAMESALSQTWEHKEIIVVDDGSLDNTLEVAHRLKHENREVIIIEQHHKGASAARNTALLNAKGEYIQYLDADDVLEPNKIKIQMNLFKNIGDMFVASGEWARFYRNTSKTVFNSQKLWADMNPIEWLVCSWTEDLMMHPAAWLVPHKISEKAGCWNERLSLNDDGEYFCRVVLASEGVRFCKGARSFYRSGIADSLSQSSSREAINSWYNSLELCTKYLLQHENSKRTRYACATRFQRFIFDYGELQPDIQQKAEVEVRVLGGTNVKPYGKTLFRILCKLFGWKKAKTVQKFALRHGFTICI